MKTEYIKNIIGNQFIFEIGAKTMRINCYSKGNRNGFKHYTDFISIDNENNFNFIYPLDAKGRKEIKLQYYNRTWERFKYQSLLYSVFAWLHKNKFINDEELAQLKKEIE